MPNAPIITVNGIDYDVKDSRVDFILNNDTEMASKNIFDGNFVRGYYINDVTGEMSSNNGYKATNFIAIRENTKYCLSYGGNVTANLHVAFYGINKQFISGITDAQQTDHVTFTTPADAAFMRFSLIPSLRQIQLEMGAFPTAYVEHGKRQYRPERMMFMTSGQNEIDPGLAISGEYINQATGLPEKNVNHRRTDYLPVMSGDWYCISDANSDVNDNVRYCWYTEKKEFISGQRMSSGDSRIIESPNNAKYIIISGSNSIWPMMLVRRASEISFRAYSTKIREEFLPVSGEEILALSVPSKIYASVGYETNVYYENISENAEKLDWRVSGDVGQNMKRGYRIVPVAADVGDHMISFKASISESSFVSKQTTLKIADEDAGSGNNVSVIILGDSTTDSGYAVQKLNENFANEAMSITTLGTRGTGANKHEGRSGWTIEDYFTKASETYTDGRGTIYNPFYNPSTQTFDASYYFSHSGVNKPDWFFINMGINDMFSYLDDSGLNNAISTAISRINQMISSIQSASSETKIGICVTIPPNKSQDAFGKAYGLWQTRSRYKRNNFIWATQLIRSFDNLEDTGVYLIPIHTALDTEWNMGMETVPVNARNPEQTYQSPVANGGVHPNVAGYWQIADVYTAFLKVYST